MAIKNLAVSVAIRPASLKPPIIKVGFFIKKMKNKIILAVIVIVLGFVIYGSFKTQTKPLGEATSGVPSVLAIATTTAVGPQQVKTIFSANSQCTSRTVGTAGQAVMLTFGDPTNGDVSSTTLTSMVGHWQGASTTVNYDSGVYGCGRWSAFGVASTTITTSEMR